MDIAVAERTPTLYKIIYRYQRTNYIEEGKKLKTFLGAKALSVGDPFLSWPDVTLDSNFLASGSEDTNVS